MLIVDAAAVSVDVDGADDGTPKKTARGTLNGGRALWKKRRSLVDADGADDDDGIDDFFLGGWFGRH